MFRRVETWFESYRGVEEGYLFCLGAMEVGVRLLGFAT